MKNYEIEVDGQIYLVKVRELPDDASMNEEHLKEKTHHKAKNISSNSQLTSIELENGKSIYAPMSGTILSILVHPGQSVKAGETLLVLEAMKMENEIVAPEAGTVKQILVKPNENVDSEQVLIVF